jgi:hypothetical protein
MPLPLEPVYTQAAQAMIQQRVLAAMLADTCSRRQGGFACCSRCRSHMASPPESWPSAPGRFMREAKVKKKLAPRVKLGPGEPLRRTMWLESNLARLWTTPRWPKYRKRRSLAKEP